LPKRKGEETACAEKLAERVKDMTEPSKVAIERWGTHGKSSTASKDESETGQPASTRGGGIENLRTGS